MHVVYGLTEIEPFVRKLESSAREMVVILAFADSPLSQLSPLWEHVHGEKRIDMPALPELMEVLWEMGIYPDLEMLEETVPVGAENRDKALEMLRHFLFVKPDHRPGPAAPERHGGAVGRDPGRTRRARGQAPPPGTRLLAAGVSE